MKKILYIHQYYKTPEEGGCIRSYHLTKGLVAAGHEVVVITAHNNKRYEQQEIEGVAIHYLPVAYDNNYGFGKRIRSFLKFFRKAIAIASKEKSVDLAYVMTTPLTTALIALYLKYIRKIPYVFEVGDLWPEVPVKMGYLKKSYMRQSAYFLESLAYRQADKLVALSPGIAAYMARIAPRKPLEIIPNMSDLISFQPVERKNNTRFKILYSGAIGVANHLEYLLSAAEAALERGLPVDFTIIGEGAERDKIRQMAQKLDNVTVLPFTNRDGLRPVIDEHDAFYVSFQKIDVLHTGCPNKYFDGLAAGKVMILNLGGWLAELTENNNCGFAYDPETPREFIDKLMPYLENEAMIFTAQENAHRLAREYSVSVAQKKLISFLESENQNG